MRSGSDLIRSPAISNVSLTPKLRFTALPSQPVRGNQRGDGAQPAVANVWAVLIA
jgi:hypothetical protein